MCAPQRVIVAKPYITLVIDPAAEFPVTIPIQGSILRCADLPDAAVTRCLDFVAMHQPMSRGASRVQEISTERYNIHVTPFSLSEPSPDVPPPPPCPDEDVTHVVVDRKSPSVRGVALAIHHTSRSLLFPVLPERGPSSYRAALVYEGGMAPFENLVHCLGMRGFLRTRTLRSPVCTSVECNGSYARHVEARAVLNIELADNTVVLKNPHIVTVSVHPNRESGLDSFCALKYG